jgi:hypothetical protein
MKLPAQYRITRDSLGKMTRIDPVAKIRNKAITMAVYAYQSKDKELISYATEIKRLATRRIGKLMEERRVAGKLAKGTRGNLAGKKKGTSRGKGKGKGSSGGVAKTPPEEEAMAKQGVDKALAKAAREAAAMSEEKFAANTARAVAVAAASVDGDREVIKAARAANHKKQQAKRTERESNLATKIAALPSKKYGVIYADPEWKFEFYSEAGKDISSAENYYQTSPLEVIKTRDVASISADDCVLFLWATVSEASGDRGLHAAGWSLQHEADPAGERNAAAGEVEVGAAAGGAGEETGSWSWTR